MGDKESLIETIEVMSDPEMMRGIAQGIEDYKNGKYRSLEEVEKELGI
jgi:PHD/YefM family antitoxin component YafN of YafNO toxin-antitoxin module